MINRGKTLDLGINFNRLDKMQIEYQNYQLGSEKFSHHVDAIQLDLENFPVADMCSVLFSALQVIAWSSPKSIELVGVDFSSVNYDQSNPNLYNVDVFNNLAVIAKLLREKDILFKTLYTESKIVELVLNSHGNCCLLYTSPSPRDNR